MIRRAVLILSLLTAGSISRAASSDTVLDEINLARTQPRQYASLVEDRMRSLPGTDERCLQEAISFLMRQRPLDPLESIPGLATSAQIHVDDQSSTGAIGHRGSDGCGPTERINRCGSWSGRAGEDISYGYTDPRTIVVTLIVDQGVPDKGHRRNIFSRDFHVAGAACGGHPRYGAMCVIDFAEAFVPKGERVAASGPWRSGSWEGY